MRPAPIPPSTLSPERRAVRDEMDDAFSRHLNAFDVSVPGREEGLPNG